ncbi:MAG TPA: TonB-dependent receptor [Chitinophagaceae bacterium]|jgi:TonB-linked SusC/RagA family outer membrane protein|nr:TonB-dependent receptor [Chitinophagaceae bacterium]
MKRCKSKGKLTVYLWTFLSVLVLGITTASAQQRRITGRIQTTNTERTVAGVTVQVKGTTRSAVTNESGEYSIEAAPGETLVFTGVGFTSREVKLGSETTVNTTLTENVRTMEDVVVVGYGRMRKSDLSSSQVSVSAEDIQKTVNTTLEQALQGRASNVYVSSNSGQPGSPLTVNIRGINSISGNTQPLYVIDGVQIQPNNGSNGSNILSTLNPDDVESMNILQGPSATAIYGSRGSNGVIVITTKRGRSGRSRFSYNTFYTLQDRPKYVPTMTLQEYAIFMNEVAKVGGTTVNPMFADPSVLGEGTNWQRELLKTAGMMKHQVSLSGGANNTTFYLSGEHLNQDGIAIGSGFRRSSVRLNLETNPRSWIKLGTNLSGSGTKEDLTVTNDDIINIAITQAPSVPLKDANGNWGGPDQTQFRQTNPVALASINQNVFKRTSGIGSAFAELTFLKGLVFRTELNGNIEYGNNMQFKPAYEFGNFKVTTSSSVRASNNSNWWGWTQLLRYNRQIQDHDFGIMASHEAQESRWENIWAETQGFINNDITDLNGGTTVVNPPTSARGSWASESYFGRLNYMFKDKYILQASYRADGSAAFGPNKRWGHFPAASVAWKISEESFMQNLAAVNDLKLRVEYGITGSQNTSQSFYANLERVPTPWGNGYIAGNFANPDLTWEETKAFNVGFDLHMFRNRLEVIADAYVKKTDGLLTLNELPYYSGGNNEWSPGYIRFPGVNIGAMENRGFGITINSVNIEKPFTWRTGLNFSLDRNKITELYRNTPVNRSAWFMTSFLSRSAVGQPAWQFYGYEALGIFESVKEIQEHAIQTPGTSTVNVNPNTGTWVGDVKFRDVNGDGYITQADMTVIGNPWPKFTFGLSNTFSYKNFELMAFVNGAQGNDIFNYARFRNENPNGAGVGNGMLKNAFNFARVSTVDPAGDPVLLNPGTRIQRITGNAANDNGKATQWYVEDGSFIRIKNVQLAYNIPNKISQRLHLEGVRLAAGVQNLATFTKYTGYDPEVGTYGGNLVGVDYGRYPSTRMYTLNLQVNF